MSRVSLNPDLLRVIGVHNSRHGLPRRQEVNVFPACLELTWYLRCNDEHADLDG